jgi:hypothetical protein
MRTAVRHLSVQDLKFTATTAERMATRGRSAPVHVLHLALNTGGEALIHNGFKEHPLGDVELTWRDESRLHSIALRTGRAQWQRSSLGTPTERVEEMSMTPELDYDINRIARIERIALRFGNGERRTARWVSIADNVFLDVDDEQSLREIRFANVQFVTDDPS